MEKTDLLNILYNERQRLAAKYSSPGWNKWVLYTALISSALYFFDLRQKIPFHFIPVVICFIIIFILTIDVYLMYQIFKTEIQNPSYLKKKKRNKKLALSSNTVIAIILWTILFSPIPKPITITPVDFQYATILFAFISALYLCLTLKNQDLSNIDYLIDQTILEEHPDINSTLNIMQAIKLDYSLNIIYDKKIKSFVENKYIINQIKDQLEVHLYKLTHFTSNEENLSFLQHTTNLLKSLKSIYTEADLLISELNNTIKYIVEKGPLNKQKGKEIKQLKALIEQEGQQQSNLLIACDQLAKQIIEIEAQITNNIPSKLYKLN
jgi:hypothetical protein